MREIKGGYRGKTGLSGRCGLSDKSWMVSCFRVSNRKVNLFTFD
jgi:hypothetical protein